jgi:hypothetical protein
MLSNSELNARSAVAISVAVKVTTISIPIKRALAADSGSHVSIIASVVAPRATNALSAILATHLRHWLSEHVAGATEGPGKRATGQEGRGRSDRDGAFLERLEPIDAFDQRRLARADGPHTTTTSPLATSVEQCFST